MSEKLQKTLLQKQFSGIDFEAGNLCYPYYGHEAIFLHALERAILAAKPAGGLVEFSVTDYKDGGMNLELSARKYNQDVVEELEFHAATAKRLSRSICAICGLPGRPQSVRDPDGNLVAACANPAHTDEQERAVFDEGLPDFGEGDLPKLEDLV